MEPRDEVTGDIVVDRLRRLIKEEGWKQWQAAENVGATQSVVSKWLRNENRPKRKNAELINALYTERFKYPDDPLAVREGQDVMAQSITMSSANGRVSVIPDQLGGTWVIPTHVGSRMGAGLRVYQMVGDSMEPSIQRGSSVFVDTKNASITTDDIYAIKVSDGVAFKRIKIMPKPNEIMMISDNRAAYGDPVVIQKSGIEILGRVVAIFTRRD
ncbi:S24 family peptidase [Agrobacterium vitis]|uniref:HTH cro/C1-type domain-containing protein n=1 Tax=Agrobacterium vitis TaxID=373 RepID=A0AAE2RC94_AGRVI|nr:S24 family peptidase [Agrobacterium vitis]MBF2715825.1 hypothetical protein [Agrobacterium vitis]